MGGLIDRLPILLEEAEEDIYFLREGANNVEKDKNGSFSNNLANLLRFVGVAQYVINADKQAFIKALQESANIRIKIIERFDNGEPISKSYVSVIAYKHLFSALSSGDFELSIRLASLVGGRKEIETEYDHPFDIAFGYALKAMVLNSVDQEEQVMRLRAIASESENKDFICYANAFSAIQKNDSDLFMSAINEVISAHKRQSIGNGVFKGLEDEVLCVWGIGLVNLAKQRGIECVLDNHLIPSILSR
ncbi:MAG: hypothetical protein D6B28_11710 [Gammaproteobacteria bacterium]|mgnify:CR=1 FL=1|nr:MAG: hypothetical protein D6B28_11710 [Gammaproteobacteria bacterium]